MNASLTPAKNACRFRKEFVPVVQAGRHEFFREPTRAERRALEKAEHAECKKYEASLRKKKHARNGKGAKGAKVAKSTAPASKNVASVTAARKQVATSTTAKKKAAAGPAVKKKGPAVAKKAPPRKVSVAKR
jgi:hypothetical protein